MSVPARQRANTVLSGAVRTLLWAERGVFFLIGVLLFGAALSLVVRGGLVLWQLMVSPPGATIEASSAFLEVVLLILMVGELAYTVILSLRGVVLSAEPFLIVGLIAVIRRILVITVGEVHGQTGSSSLSQSSVLELLILTGVVLAFVVSIIMMRSRKSSQETDELDKLHNDGDE